MRACVRACVCACVCVRETYGGRTYALHASSPGSRPGLGEYYSRCKNLALYIRDCESICLSDETVKSRWSLLSGVYARGSKRSHTEGKCVTCRGLHILT